MEQVLRARGIEHGAESRGQRAKGIGIFDFRLTIVVSHRRERPSKIFRTYGAPIAGSTLRFDPEYLDFRFATTGKGRREINFFDLPGANGKSKSINLRWEPCVWEGQGAEDMAKQ
jgi:hypothetical protein